jgi:hypothetical protein
MYKEKKEKCNGRQADPEHRWPRGTGDTPSVAPGELLGHWLHLRSRSERVTLCGRKNCAFTPFRSTRQWCVECVVRPISSRRDAVKVDGNHRAEIAPTRHFCSSFGDARFTFVVKKIFVRDEK